MDSDNTIRFSDDLLSIDETSIAKPNVTLATLDLRWIVAALFVVALLMNLVVPFCIAGWERNLPKWNTTFFEFRLSDWIAGLAYGMKFGEMLMIGTYLAIGNYHWAKRLLIVACGTLVLSSAHIVGFRWAGWAPPMFIAVMCYLISISATLSVGVCVGLIAKWNGWIIDRTCNFSRLSRVSHQIDTRLLFSMMIAVAIFIPILKKTLSLADAGNLKGNDILNVVLWAVWFVAALCSLIVVQTIAFLVPNAQKTRFAFGILIFGGPLLFQWMAQNMMQFRLSTANVLLAYWVSFGLIGSTSFIFVLLRLMGFQLRRRE